jgi:hypothetical protein
MSDTVERRWRRYASNIIVALPLVTAVGYLGYQRTVAGAGADGDRGRDALLALVGAPVPDVPVTGPRGEGTTLQAVVGSRPAMVVIVHPSCGHCHDEILAAMALGEATSEAVDWVVVSVGEDGPSRDFHERYPEIPLYVDAESTLQRRYGLSTVPVTWSIDGHGIIRRVRFGASEAALRAQFQEIAES